jgi:hypothetical protein
MPLSLLKGAEEPTSTSLWGPCNKGTCVRRGTPVWKIKHAPGFKLCFARGDAMIKHFTAITDV